jgi:hypothetical protein
MTTQLTHTVKGTTARGAIRPSAGAMNLTPTHIVPGGSVVVQ